MAYFGSSAGKPNQPAGLEDLTGYQSIDIGGQFTDVTWAVQAESLLNRVGATATSYVASATTCEILASLKKFSGTSLTSNDTLLQADPTQRTQYTVNGTPLYWVPEGVVEDGVVWCNNPPKAFVVVREDVELISSPWPGFHERHDHDSGDSEVRVRLAARSCQQTPPPHRHQSPRVLGGASADTADFRLYGSGTFGEVESSAVIPADSP